MESLFCSAYFVLNRSSMKREERRSKATFSLKLFVWQIEDSWSTSLFSFIGECKVQFELSIVLRWKILSLVENSSMRFYRWATFIDEWKEANIAVSSSHYHRRSFHLSSLIYIDWLHQQIRERQMSTVRFWYVVVCSIIENKSAQNQWDSSVRSKLITSIGDCATTNASFMTRRQLIE